MEIDKASVTEFRFFGCLAIICLGAGSCWCSLAGGFVFDDTEVILNNEDILPSTPIKNIFSHDYWGCNIRNNLSHKSYRPLTILTFRLNYILFGGLKAWSFHLVNIILHIVVSLLSWPVFLKMLGKEREVSAFYAAALFSVHPIHSEAICGIAGRADLLAGLFFFLSFLAYTRAVVQEPTSWMWISISIILATVSMFCKEQGITVIGIIIVYEILFNHKIEIHKILTPWQYLKLRRKSVPNGESFITRQILLIFSSSILILLRCYLMDFKSPPFQVLDNPASFEKNWLTRVLSYNYIFFLNLWLLLCPEWLCFDWSMGCIPIVQYMDKRVIFVFLFWIFFSFIIWKGFSIRNMIQQRDILMSVALMVIPFLPASNLFFRVGFVLAERVLYIPSAGFCLLVASGAEVLRKSFPVNRNDVHLGYFLLLMIFLIRSYVRSADWMSEQALFYSGLFVCPLNAKVHYNVAIAAVSGGRTSEAIAEYREAIRLNPDYYQAFNNLANILKNEGSLDEAEVLLHKALSINKEFPAAWMNLGVVLAQKKKFKEAEESYYKALSYRKNYPDCYYNLGKLYLEEKKFNEAEKSWRIAVKLKPRFTAAWNNLIILMSQKDDHTQAVTLAREALILLGDEPSIHFNMANALGKLGEFDESEQHFLTAIRLKPNNPQYHVNLGVLYHRWKKYRSAEEYYERALKLQPNFKAAKENYDLLKKVFEKGRILEI